MTNSSRGAFRHRFGGVVLRPAPLHGTLNRVCFCDCLCKGMGSRAGDIPSETVLEIARRRDSQNKRRVVFHFGVQHVEFADLSNPTCQTQFL